MPFSGKSEVQLQKRWKMGRSRKTGHTGRGLSVLEQLPVLQQEFVGGKKKSSKTEASHLSEYPVHMRIRIAL